MRLSKKNIILIVITIVFALTIYLYFRITEQKHIEDDKIVVAPTEVFDNAQRLCKSMWPGAEDVQNKCIYEQTEAGKKVYNDYMKYILNKEDPYTDKAPTSSEEKEHIVRKCLEYGQTILHDNSFALDYVETLKCCEYSFTVWGFKKASWYQYNQYNQDDN
jgi:hypothetical protein